MTKTTTIVAEGVSEAWLKVLRLIDEEGQTASPRGFGIKELKNLSVEIKNPTKRILSSPIRKMSLPFAFGEIIWYLSGRNDVSMMEYYSKRMRTFSDDGETLNSAYGYRIFGKHPMIPFDQWEFVVDKLREDPDSRQAIVHLHTPNNKKTKDEVCTLTLQFMIRDGKLDMFTNMRSNDIVWGFTYDVFSFTFMQELMANELNVEMGSYFHNAISMHLYEKDFYLLEFRDIFDDLLEITKHEPNFSLNGMTLYDEDLGCLVNLEEDIRNNSIIISNTRNVLERKYCVDGLLGFKNRFMGDKTTRIDYIANTSLLTMLKTFTMFALHKNKMYSHVIDLIKYDNLYDLMFISQLSGVKLEDSEMFILEGPDGSGKSTIAETGVQVKMDLVNKGELKFNYPIVLHYNKPDESFNKYIYAFTTMMSGSIILDRFFYSEWVYAKYFGRISRISFKEMEMYERLLNRRGADVTFILLQPDVCKSRLGADDESMTIEDCEKLRESYLLTSRVSSVNFKNFIYTQKDKQ